MFEVSSGSNERCVEVFNLSLEKELEVLEVMRGSKWDRSGGKDNVVEKKSEVNVWKTKEQSEFGGKEVIQKIMRERL